ncbi:thiamine ABC transporter substrate-binding protein [Candidatus Micrarchaeota archaeon]|nr:thiamine ABC transporter substrate-binding protein [Candidatus Micrarchaeota archaeon]
MLKKIILLLALSFILIFFWMGGEPANEKQIQIATVSPQLEESELVVYTYDGITAEWGLGPKIFPEFEKICDCKVKVVAKGDVGAIMAQLNLEKAAPKADIALGIDNTFREKAIELDLLEPYSGKLDGLEDGLFDSDARFIPFDWGYLAFVYDSEKIREPPKNLEDLTDIRFAKKIITEDARTSSPGKVFLYWVASEYGEGTGRYLERLEPNLLTITPGWSEAYNLFLSGEAPIVLSYSTSPAYHMINENTTRYKAAIFEKMYRQIEYVSIVKGAKNKELAEKFAGFMISEKAQNEIPLGNYMYPSRKATKLPEEFKNLENPDAYPEIQNGNSYEAVWEKVFSN